MRNEETEMLEMFVDNDNSVSFETRVKNIINRYFRGCGITHDESYIDVIRDGCRKLSYFKPEDVSDKLKYFFYNIPDYVKLHKSEIGYQITYPAIAYTVVNDEDIPRGVELIRRKVLSEAIRLYIALNDDRTEFIVEDSIPYNILIGNRESYLNYMRNKTKW